MGHQPAPPLLGADREPVRDPVARVHRRRDDPPRAAGGTHPRASPSLKVFLNATAIGILLFLVWDVLSAAWEPIDTELAGLHSGGGSLGAAIGYGVIFFVGLAVGLASLVHYERWMGRRLAARQAAPARPHGPGATTVGELTTPRGLASWSAARQPVPAHRRRDRAAQLRRGAGDRPVRRGRRDRPGADAGDRLRRCTTPPRASASSPRWPATSTPTAGRDVPPGASCSAWARSAARPTFVGTSSATASPASR